MKIRENIDRLRGERKLGAATVAASAGIALSTWYRRMEHPGGFTIDELDAVAAVLSVPRAEITG